MKPYKIKFMTNGKSLEQKEKVFDSLSDAKSCFESLASDNYACERIVLLDLNKNNILASIEFDKGIYSNTFYDSDIVKLKEEFCSELEKTYIFKLSDINENTGRCLITCLNSRNLIPCAECVGLDMITKAA